MKGIDIGLFDFDRHNALYYFIMNADEHIYMRYGGRDSESADAYLDLESLEVALEQGLEQGREAGLLEGKREALLRQLGAKFGPLPEGATTGVESIESVSELDDCLERILTARSLQEMGL